MVQGFDLVESATDADGLYDALIRIWNVPQEKREPKYRTVDYFANADVAPELAACLLLARFPEHEVRDRITEFLEFASDSYERDRRLNSREMFLAGCCLRLIAYRALIPPHHLIGRLVTAFYSVHWYSAIKDVIRNHLRRDEVLASLVRGLTEQVPVALCISCLEGIRLYRGIGANADEFQMSQLIAQAQAMMTKLEQNRNQDIREAVHRAQQFLRKWQESPINPN